jgi:co-chaperonin GroES (HSP10)
LNKLKKGIIMIVKPLKDKVLIAEGKKDTTTESGIILDGRGLGNTTPGIVIAVGPDVKEVKEGDTIYLDWSKASPVNVDGAQRVMISESMIIAVLEV